jgi:hypothetical protein
MASDEKKVWGEQGEVFLDTGIPHLNDLLTRYRHRGIALPTDGGFASSTTVIKGAAGAGKSVLTSIISYNIHGRPIFNQGKNESIPTSELPLPFLPVVIYFSYAQPARGIYRYLAEVLATKPSHFLPIILSPKYSLGTPDLGGISALRRSLISSLSPFRILPFEPYDRTAIKSKKKQLLNPDSLVHKLDSKFEHCLNHLTESDIWQLGKERESLNTALSNGWSNKLPDDAKLVPIVVIDPINFFFDYRDSRSAISDLISTFRTLKWPLIMTLEDSGNSSEGNHRQLTSYVEFEADLVIELTVCSEPHIRRSIEITKSRNMQPRFGKQMYRIEKPDHAFSNIFPKADNSQKGDPNCHPGFMIFPSIHWVLSRSYDRNDNPGWTFRSGISELDKVLDKKTTGESVNRYLPPDASVLIRGEKGGHKLPLSFNILVRGLLDRGVDEGPGTVMLICLGEETYMTIPEIPLASSFTSEGDDAQYNNSENIYFKSKPEDLPAIKQSKVMCHKWEACSHVDDEFSGRLIEVTFKPGYLTPEEFLWVVGNLVQQHKPNRVMIDNTAHLRMRFPDLFNEKMLFPALSCMAKDKNQPFMLIVTDVTGKGSWEELSYGLAAGADVVIDVAPITKEEYSDNEALRKALKSPILKNEEIMKVVGEKAPIWSKISVSNVRGKQYVRKRHALTVLPVPQASTAESEHASKMFMVDITAETTPSMNEKAEKSVSFILDEAGKLTATFSEKQFPVRNEP